MDRHRFNPIAFIFGLLFVAAATAHFVSDALDRTIEGRWIWPAFLVIGGLAIIAGAVSRLWHHSDASSDDDQTAASANQA